MKRLSIILAIILAASSVWAQDSISLDDLMKGDSRTLYEIIGIKKKDNGVNLPRVYTKYLKKHHPSKVAADSAGLKELAKVSLAYHVLYNVPLRKIYDSQGLEGLKDKIRVPELLPPMYNGDYFRYRTELFSACSKASNRRMLSLDKGSRYYRTVFLSYLLEADNSVSDIKVEESSGYGYLDSIAVNSLRAAVDKKAKHITPAYSLAEGKPSESRQAIYITFYPYGKRSSNTYVFRERHNVTGTVSPGENYRAYYLGNGMYSSYGLYNPYFNWSPSAKANEILQWPSPKNGR